MSRNLTDYTIIPSLASEMLRNFTDCILTLPFNSRHVAELHGLRNDGCQVPRSGQARVASQQTDDPRTKLGYDRKEVVLEPGDDPGHLRANVFHEGGNDENPEIGQIQAKGPSGEGRRPKWRRTKPPSGEG